MFTKTRSFKTSLTSLRGKSWIRIVIGSLSAATSQETSYLQAIQHQGFYSQRFSLSIEASRPPKNILWTKPQRFFAGASFCEALRSGAGWVENSLGQKSNFFLANLAPASKTFDLFLAMARNWLILARNLYILARICMFWRDKTRPGEEIF